MTGIKLAINCGCGIHTSSLEAAEMHSNSTGHKMTVAGTIVPHIEMPKARADGARRFEVPSMDDIHALRLKFSG